MTVAADAVNMFNTTILIGIIVGSISVILASLVGTTLSYGVISTENAYAEKQSSTSSMPEMCRALMSQVPKDVIIKTISRQQVPLGKEASFVLVVTDKKTNKPLANADVLLHIEEGAPMAMMNKMGTMGMMSMMENMFNAENIGDGKYLVKFTPTTKGIYTMHTHAIPAGKSMMSMMNNHMDIGIIVK